MTVRELILRLGNCGNLDAEVTVYESDPDDFLTIGKVEIVDNGNQVRLHSQLAVDGDLC